jgi:hypothetical protein
MYTEEKFREDHVELSRAFNYPPLYKNEKYIVDLNKATNDLIEKIGDDGDWSKAGDNPFAEIRNKYESELSEANLYMKRYGSDFMDAREAYEKDQ